MHMLTRKDVNSAKLETVRTSRNPATVITANGEVQTNEEPTVYVHDLELSVAVQILGNTRAVLSLGKVCEEHGYSHERASGQKPQFTNHGKTILRNTENFVPLVVPGLATGSSSSSACPSSTSLPQDTYDDSSSSPAPERSDDKSVPASGNRSRNPTKTQKKHKNKDKVPASGNRFRDLPVWLKELTENLADEEVPASRDTPANTSQDSHSERPTKVISKMHSIYTHFPKDRNCEICMRTKITRAPYRKRTGDAVLRAENFGDF